MDLLPKIKQIARKSDEDLWDGQRLDAESLLALRCIPEEPFLLFSPLLMVSRVLHNSIASGFDENSWGTLCIPISCCISIRDTDAVETQALAISCHKEQGMDLLGSLFAKGHRHQRCFEALEVEWLEP